MSTVARKWTYDDLAALPEDNLRREILDGELVATASPVTKHQRVSMRLSYAIQHFLQENPIGELFLAPFDVVFSADNVCSPDLVYVRQERAEIITPKNIEGAPDLVIEILSESSWRNDEIRKRRIYERFGVGEYWIVDPEIDAVRVHRREARAFVLITELTAAKGDVLNSPLFPGLTIELASLFR